MLTRVSTSDIPPSQMTSPVQAWDEQCLIDGLLCGDRAAATAAYELLLPAIERALRRVLRQKSDDFDDLVQITFERILKNLAEGKFERRSSLRTWASAIASHVALDAIRRNSRARGRTLELPDHENLPSSIRTETRLESISELNRVQNVLAQMKPDLAETLILHDVLGYHLHEVATMRNVGEPATQSRLLRARKELKRRVAAAICRRES